MEKISDEEENDNKEESKDDVYNREIRFSRHDDESENSIEENKENMVAEVTESNGFEPRDDDLLSSDDEENKVENLKSNESNEEDKIELSQNTNQPREEEVKEDRSPSQALAEEHKKNEEEKKLKEQEEIQRQIEQRETLYQQRVEFWSKKKMGFVNLKSWQEERKNIIALHKKILDSIDRNTIEKLKISAKETQKIIQYFLQIAEHEKTYSELIKKNSVFLAEIKLTYQNNGQGLMSIYENMETYESNISKDKLFASKVIKEIVDETLGKVFKEMIKKTELFISKVAKIRKKLTVEEKECEKSYLNFSTMLEEAEICINNGKLYDKDFWLAENQCMVTSKKEYDKHKELCTEIIEIWDRAQEIEEERIRSLKQLYDLYFKRTKQTNEHSKKLMELVEKSQEDDISSKIYRYKAMITEDDLKACHHLDEILETKVDFSEMSTKEFKKYMLNVKIRDAPQTTFILKEGTLKRDPGFMKSWRDVICIITTEGFFHGFNLRSDKDPVFTINCQKVTITPKKGTKFEVAEERKGFFKGGKRIWFKANSLIEMEDWIKALHKSTS